MMRVVAILRYEGKYIFFTLMIDANDGCSDQEDKGIETEGNHSVLLKHVGVSSCFLVY